MMKRCISPFAAFALFALSQGCVHQDDSVREFEATARGLPPVTLARARAQEQRIIPLRAVRSPGGVFQFQTELHGEPKFHDVEGGATQVDLPVGASVPVQCMLRPDQPDPASLLVSIFEQARRQVKDLTIQSTDAGAIDFKPYIAAEAFYTSTRGKETIGGAVRAMAFALPSVVFVCVHDEPGYRATFRRVVTSIARTMRVDGADPQPAAEAQSISVIRQQGRAVGFVLEERTRTDTGGTVETTTSSRLVLRSPREIIDRHDLDVRFADRQGFIEKHVSAADMGHDSIYSLSASRLRGNTFVVRGAVDNDVIETSFTAEEPLLATWRQTREIASRLTAPSASLSFFEYDPSSDPRSATRTLWRSTSTPRLVEVVSGSRHGTARLDDSGERAQMILEEPRAFEIIRVASRSNGR